MTPEELILQIQRNQLEMARLAQKNQKGCIAKFFDAIEAHPVATLATILVAGIIMAKKNNG